MSNSTEVNILLLESQDYLFDITLSSNHRLITNVMMPTITHIMACFLTHLLKVKVIVTIRNLN